QQNARTNSAVAPVPRDQEKPWMDRHTAMNARVQKGDVSLLFIGDSITEGWEGAGKATWDKFYGARKAVNLGIGGDRRKHLLWRLDQGNTDRIRPNAAVLMIGTNNSNGDDNTAEEIAAGIDSIIKRIRVKLPDTKLLVLGIFPRGQKPDA